ncbi:MAG: hypothetical protein IJ371_05250 [Clostridia bacterium]|nr:hypothetical protein [Clostridia bacterium]
MSEKDLKKQVAELEKSLKGEKDLNAVLEIWGKIACLSAKLRKMKEGELNEQYC